MRRRTGLASLHVRSASVLSGPRLRAHRALGRFRPHPAVLRPLLTALLILTALAPVPAPASAASTFHVLGGSASGDGAVQLIAFMPNELYVNVGDTVEWKFIGGTEHTITFAAPGGTSNMAPATCNGVPSNADPCVWTGTSMVNSGRKNDGETYGITFQASPGDYPFICLVHAAAPQSGTLHLRAAGTAYPKTPSAVNAEAKTQEAQLIQQGHQLRTQLLGTADPANGKLIVGGSIVNDTSGGRQVVSIDRFLPQNVTVNVGEEVTWTSVDTVVPHTVTFGQRPAGSPAAPLGLDGTGHATLTQPYPELFAGLPRINSGFIGVGRPLGTTFTAKFNAPGVYQYYCALHDNVGMVGTVNVVPNTTGSSVQKSVSPSQGTVGGTVTFTVTLNLASPQAGVEVLDTLSNVGQSPATQFVTNSAKLNAVAIGDPHLATNQPNRIQYHFALGDLPAGTHTLTYEVQLSETLGCYTTASNGATLDATGVSGNLGTTSLSFPIRCAP